MLAAHRKAAARGVLWPWRRLRQCQRPCSSAAASPAAPPRDDADADHDPIRVIFPTHFQGNASLAVTKQRSGAFLPLTDEELKKYLGDELPPALQEEFVAGGKTWMIRDTSKFLLLLLERWEQQLATQRSVNHPTVMEVEERGLAAKVKVPQLTDRAEWKWTLTKYFVNGALLGTEKPSESSDQTNAKQPLDDNAPMEEMEELEVTFGPQSPIEQALRSICAKNGLPDKVLLTGEEGSGKSFLLNQLVYYARQRGWLCLFISNGWAQVHKGYRLKPLTSDLFDNVWLSAQTLRELWTLHGAQLKDLPIQFPQPLKRYQPIIQRFRDTEQQLQKLSKGANKATPPTFLELRQQLADSLFPDRYIFNTDNDDRHIVGDFDINTFEFRTLYDVLLFGIALPEFAGAMFLRLVQELKNVPPSANVNILFAVDGYNVWQGLSSYSPEGTDLPSKQILVPYALNFITRDTQETAAYQLQSGFCIAATSQHHSEGRSFPMYNVKASVPLHIRVGEYNQTEYVSAVARYLHDEKMWGTKMSVTQLSEYRMLTGSNPKEVRQELPAYFVPKSFDGLTPDEIMLMGILEDEVDVKDAEALISKQRYKLDVARMNEMLGPGDDDDEGDEEGDAAVEADEDIADAADGVVKRTEKKTKTKKASTK